MIISPGFAGRRPLAGWRQATWHLTGTFFDPVIFHDSWKSEVVSHRTNEPIYLVDGTSSELGWKRATRAIMAYHRGKKNHESETFLLRVSYAGKTVISQAYLCATLKSIDFVVFWTFWVAESGILQNLGAAKPPRIKRFNP